MVLCPRNFAYIASNVPLNPLSVECKTIQSLLEFALRINYFFKDINIVRTFLCRRTFRYLRRLKKVRTWSIFQMFLNVEITLINHLIRRKLQHLIVFKMKLYCLNTAKIRQCNCQNSVFEIYIKKWDIENGF